jgi:hypothetical protein
MDLIYIAVGVLIIAFLAIIIAGKRFRKKNESTNRASELRQEHYDNLAEEKRAIMAKEEELLVEHPYFKLKKLRLQREKADSAGDQVKVTELDDQIDSIREKYEGAGEDQLERAYHEQLGMMRKRLSKIEIEMREILRQNT